jgi:UDPglucose 6-dehydrogenase
MEDSKIIVTKSTVPVGSAHLIKHTVEETLLKMKKRIVFHVASNPEFLKEGDAVNDFMKPDRIILGCDDELTEQTLKSIYAPFTRSHDCCIVMDIKSAELTKYASNAMLASKISIMNELSHIAERVGADIEQVRIGIGSDSRIGYSFIYPGIGYGGSCLPKDIVSLSSTAKAQGYDTRILNAVQEVNQKQKKVLIDKILFHFKGSVTDCVFGLWGLSFKPKTDDMREAPSRIIIETLTELGAKIKAYDPIAMKECEKLYSNQPNLSLCKTKNEAIHGSDGLILATEWKAFQSPDFSMIKQLLKSPVIFDGRNLYDPNELEELGFSYYAIGRGKKSQPS